MQVKLGMKCPTCGAALYVSGDERSTQCRYCRSMIEISRFAQEEKQLIKIVGDMKTELNQAAQRVEDALNEYSRTGEASVLGQRVDTASDVETGVSETDEADADRRCRTADQNTDSSRNDSDESEQTSV